MIKLIYFHRHSICAVMQVDADQVLDVSECFIIFIMKINTVTAGVRLQYFPTSFYEYFMKVTIPWSNYHIKGLKWWAESLLIQQLPWYSNRVTMVHRLSYHGTDNLENTIMLGVNDTELIKTQINLMKNAMINNYNISKEWFTVWLEHRVSEMCISLILYKVPW